MPPFKHEFYAIAIKLEGGGYTATDTKNNVTMLTPDKTESNKDHEAIEALATTLICTNRQSQLGSCEKYNGRFSLCRLHRIGWRFRI